MGVTFNRRPNGFSIPNSSDVKQHYFNHYNWKGINQNSNFLAVDQETFQDANNVYVDDDGLLKSRSPIKFKHKFENRFLKDIKVFDDIIICTYLDKDGEWNIGIMTDEEWVIDFKAFSGYPLKAFRSGNYVYIFTNDGCLTYDVINCKMIDTRFYEAITRIYTGLNFNTFENENLMSSKNRYRYILYPTIESENDDKWVPNSINPNAYGKIGSYTHFINEDKVTHEVLIDSEKKFLNVIHQPLFQTGDDFYIENVWHDVVPTWVIRNEKIYRYRDNKIEVASLTDGIFYTLYETKDYDDFVEIRLAQSNRILVVFSSGYYTINEIDEVDIGSYIGLSYYISLNERLKDGEYHGFGIGFTGSASNLQITASILVRKAEARTEHAYLNLLSSQNASYLLVYGKVKANGSISMSGDDTGFTSRATWCMYNVTIFDGTSNQGRGHYDIIHCNEAYADNVYIQCTTMRQVTISGSGTTVNFGSTGSTGTVGPESPKPQLKSQLYPVFINEQFIEMRGLFYPYYGDKSKVGYGKLSIKNSKISFDDTFTYSTDLMNKNLSDNCHYYDDIFLRDDDGLKYGHFENDEFKGQLISSYRGPFTLSDKYWLLCPEYKDVALSNYRLQNEELDVKIDKVPEINGSFDILVKSNKLYGNVGNNFYIGEIIIDPDDDLEKLYFRKEYKHILDENITGLHPISNNELAIFTTNNTWYNVLSDGVYYYNQSKIVPSLKNKSELITLPDSTTTLMPSVNGVVALSYQNFVNTTEQSTVNLTQDLTKVYSEFKNDIRVINWKQYTLFYEDFNSIILIYDNRLGSWWRWNVPMLISCLFVYDDTLFALCEGSIYEFTNSSDSYFDETENGNCNIQWYVESQKLYLGAHNYYKHITNLTLSSVQDGENNLSLNLNIKNYRKWVDNGKAENFDYRIDVIRTYIKRVNYAKVCEFQYKLSSDDDCAINAPLALSNITVKYKIGGQVR